MITFILTYATIVASGMAAGALIMWLMNALDDHQRRQK